MKVIIIIILLIFSVCKYNNLEKKDTHFFEKYLQQDISRKANTLDYNYIYTMLNKPIFNIDLFRYTTVEEICKYSEETKGEFVPTIDNESIFPAELIELLEKSLYNSAGYHGNQIQNVIETDYFTLLNKLNYTNFIAETDDLYHLFPKLHKYKERFESQYDMYKFISGTDNCIDMFYFNNDLNEYNYVFVYSSGASYGSYTVSLQNSEFEIISEFEIQNNGYGKVIKYLDTFYYIFLQYNYNLKNYDGIRLYKLDEDAKYKNILIRYLPEEYLWKNIYRTQTPIDLSIDNYINSIKNIITSDEYFEKGLVNDIYVFKEDGTEAYNFNKCDYNIDFANINVPIYINMHNHIPSNYGTTWNLKSEFYIYNEKENSFIELVNLNIDKIEYNNELVQMWFKEIDNKVFTFQLYHISDYNYMLNVILISGDKITQIRKDILCPKRVFKLLEGHMFHII